MCFGGCVARPLMRAKHYLVDTHAPPPTPPAAQVVCGFGVTREQADALLSPHPKGTFLLRFGSQVRRRSLQLALLRPAAAAGCPPPPTSCLAGAYCGHAQPLLPHMSSNPTSDLKSPACMLFSLQGGQLVLSVRSSAGGSRGAAGGSGPATTHYSLNTTSLQVSWAACVDPLGCRLSRQGGGPVRPAAGCCVRPSCCASPAADDLLPYPYCSTTGWRYCWSGMALQSSCWMPSPVGGVCVLGACVDSSSVSGSPGLLPAAANACARLPSLPVRLSLPPLVQATCTAGWTCWIARTCRR